MGNTLYMVGLIASGLNIAAIIKLGIVLITYTNNVNTTLVWPAKGAYWINIPNDKIYITE